MKNFNILFTSAGRRVELIESFKKALNTLNLDGKIIVSDCQPNAPTASIADYCEKVPRVNAPNYIQKIQDICQKYNIKLLIPLIDPELYLLSLHKKDFDKIGVTVLVSSPLTNEICFDKRHTANFFQKIGINTPKIFSPQALLQDSNAKYPFLIKPANGSCSRGVTIINNAKELKFFKDYIPNAIVQELIFGQEYTLDILLDFTGKVKCIVPRLRIATRAGEISKGITVKDRAIIEAGKEVAEALPGAIGCLTLQCFQTTDNKIIFIEINPRFGGGVPLSIRAGANYPEWILKMLLQKELAVTIDDWQEGLMMLRHDESIFIDSKQLNS